MISNTQITAQPEYDIQFWNAMRNKEAREDILAKGRDISTGTYSMPTVAAGKVMNEIEKESDFRKIATVIRAYKNGYKIFAKDCKDKAEFVAEGAAIPVYESAGDFNEKTIESYKLASIVTLDEDCVNDAGFDIEKYLTQKLGKSFGKAEDNAVDSTAEGTANTQSDAAKAEATEADTQQPQMSTIVITATGDCTLGNNQEQSYDGSFNSYYDSKGQDYFFGGVRDIFEADDMTLINLECVLSDATERVEKRWNLKGKPEYIGIMTGSSIEACSLGNNHTYDYGQQGLDDTRNVLDNAGIVYGFNDHTGIYETADGTRIGIVSVSLLSQNGDREAYIQNGIAQLREQGAAIVIACCHWGIEGDHYPNDYQQAAAHRIIDWGADLVVGNHPHVLQGMEVYNGKMICYSLGNFCFGGNKNPADKNTAIYQQAFTLINGELQPGIDARIIPCTLSSVSSYNDFRPTVASGEKAQEICNLMNTYSQNCSNIEIDELGNLHVN